MSLDNNQKSVLTWIVIISVAGFAIYKIGKNLGIINTPVDSPLPDSNMPKAKDYTHTENFDSANVATQIHDFFKWFGTDPFTDVFNLIKDNVLTQGDWMTLNASFNSLYGENVFNYFQDLGGGIKPIPFWDEFSSSELQQITTYVNSLPL